MYCVYRERRGEWRLAVLEPGITEDHELLIRPLAEPEHEVVPAEDVIALVGYSGEATTVYPFIEIEPLDESLVHPRLAYAANIKLPPVDPQLFVQSGYEMVRSKLERLRDEKLSLLTIRSAAIFAALSARRGNRECEVMYYKLWPYVRSGELPHMTPTQIQDVISRKMTGAFAEKYARSIWGWCEAIEPIMNSGFKDKALRREIALNFGVGMGLGLAKFSFMLELLGQNCACLDTHMLAMLTGSDQQAVQLSNVFGSRSNKKWPRPWKPFTPAAVKQYELQERRMYMGNEFYRSDDPMGIARTQWMTWEVLRGEPTEHLSLLETLRAHLDGEEGVPDLWPYLTKLKGAAHIKWRRVAGKWRPALKRRRARGAEKPRTAKTSKGQREIF